jgi:hypothetical protein
VSRAFAIVSLIASIFLALAVFGGLIWANTLYIRAQPLEKDFLVPWLGAQTFLDFGNTPYENATTQRIQLRYYGRLAEEDEDLLRVATPLFVETLYFPFALISDYTIARSLWMTLGEAALAAITILSLRLSAWRLLRWFLPPLMLSIIFWPQALLALLGGGPNIFIALFAIRALVAFHGERDELCGTLLALAVLRPAATGLLVLFVLWWAVSHRRWRVLWGFLILLGLLLVLSFFIFPGWFMPYLRNAFIESQYHPGLKPVIFLSDLWPALGGKLGWLLTAGFGILLLVEWIISRRKDFRHFLWVACLTIAVTPLMGGATTIADQVILVLPLLFVLAVVSERWSRPGRRWLPGILLTVFFAGLWILGIRLVSTGALESLRGLLFFSLPIATIVGLYWLRWYAVNPPRTWPETLQE